MVDKSAAIKQLVKELKRHDLYKWGQIAAHFQEDEWFQEILKEIEDLKRGIGKDIIAAKFHNTVAEFTLNLCDKIRKDTGINKITLSGGVFQNRLLLRIAMAALESDSFEFYTHWQVSCNDHDILLG